ncbi:MAG: class I SAM-dependent methyltransferase [Candidatus Krumholzibacteriia bacterium]
MSMARYILRRRRAPQGQKGWYRFAHGFAKTSRTQIINHLIRRNGYRDYLEIGIHANDNFPRIIAAHKEGVDPAPNGECDHVMTSDEYFACIPAGKEFDIVFVDGLHLQEQVTRDVHNALQHLRDGGAVVLHDCNPPTEWHQRAEQGSDTRRLVWNGTVWRAWAKLRCERDDLSMHVVDTDWGVGIIRRGRQEPYRLEPGDVLDYACLDRNRAKLLNLISVERFLEIF